MGSTPLPAGDPAQRHEKVTAFVSRSATIESKVVPPAGADHLDVFGSESDAPELTEPEYFHSRPPRDMRPIWIGLGIGAAAGLVIAAIVLIPSLGRGGDATRLGRVTIGTTPIGTEVTIDGQPRGLTPLSLQLDPGTHIVKLQHGSEERTMSLQVTAGAEMSQHYEFAPQPAPAAVTSTLSVITEPPGARVSIDGEPRGTSPVTVADLSAARHRVTVSGEGGTLERQVTTEAGVASSVVFSLPKSAPLTAGWLAIASPFEVQVLEKGDLIGNSASPRFMISAGGHEIDLVNEALGFREHRRVDITSGATANLKIDARGSVNVNARPWADVLVDGRAAGQTPIANLTLTLGSHQLVFRHPELGERQQTVVVTASGPNRISVDLTR